MGFFDEIPESLQGTMFQPSPPQRKQSILDRVLGLYGQDPATHIPGGRNAALKKGLQGGAQAIMASQLAGQNPSAMQQLTMASMGLQGGGPAVAQEKDELLLKDMLQQGNVSPQHIQMMMMQALASGDQKKAALLGNMLSTQQKAEAGQASKARGIITKMPMGEDGEMHNVLLDPIDGTVLKDLGKVPPPKGVVIDGVDAQGNPIKKLVDPTTGKDIRHFEQAEKPPSQYASEAASRLSQFRIARQNIVDGLEATGRGPTWAEWELYNSGLPGRKAIGGDMQGLLQAQNLIVTQIAKELGGVRGAASREFRNAIARTYLIAPGDQPKNIEQTLEALEEMEKDLERKAGGVFDMSQSEIAGLVESGGEIHVDEDGYVSLSGMSPEDF